MDSRLLPLVSLRCSIWENSWVARFFMLVFSCRASDKRLMTPPAWWSNLSGSLPRACVRCNACIVARTTQHCVTRRHLQQMKDETA